MSKAVLIKTVEIGERYSAAISVISGIWFWLTIAVYAGWLPLPDIPYPTDQNAWVPSAIWNAVWWGVACPSIDKRRAEMRAASSNEADHKG